MKIAIILPVSAGGGSRNELVEFEGVVVRSSPEKEEPGIKDYDIAIFFLGMRDRARLLVGLYAFERMLSDSPA